MLRQNVKIKNRKQNLTLEVTKIFCVPIFTNYTITNVEAFFSNGVRFIYPV